MDTLQIPGWILNPNEDTVARVRRALERTGGQCPCVASDAWNNNTMCPCLRYRCGAGCHCNLYVKDEPDVPFPGAYGT